MDNRLRRNEICVIGLPRCDFVFGSTRSCFIAYGFVTSSLELEVLKPLLEQRGIEPMEAGGLRTPGENAFCAKICSKIITAQFCIALVNNDVVDGGEKPNANVNMEYGLMLGFNKHVIPFQRREQSLPFNVAGLDTVKYTNHDFARLAAEAIDLAIRKTTPASAQVVDLNQRIAAFLLSREMTYARIDSSGDQAIYDLGAPLGFNLLIDFAGTSYTFFGNFPHLRPEAAVWRVRMAARAIDKRRASFGPRTALGVMTAEQAWAAETVFGRVSIWILVTSSADREAVREALASEPITYAADVFALSDIEDALQALGGAIG